MAESRRARQRAQRERKEVRRFRRKTTHALGEIRHVLACGGPLTEEIHLGEQEAITPKGVRVATPQTDDGGLFSERVVQSANPEEVAAWFVQQQQKGPRDQGFNSIPL